ncbi:DUF4433 domain-containing protein [Aureibaculum sp. 2210JD6-5]|uniref:type II toxin-antitoxin system toxin DNA ADP-ribosyl transferase DarT n=1 Tax=Aureibaculum sp. 2210JD6-5 TaxID=3103957 RepID=UPI002AADF59F|nr:DUF4433 domain-containing protein [Aureibaculum sp. 2210JD6-5]MDY7396215.1 DUF4433 domain-containing protein [Aureibaculum sp. 2210JD6-5]
MTHIQNIPHIHVNGITHKDSKNANNVYKSIGDSTLISTRNNFIMPNGRTLGEYIPFYFGYRTPMLYVIQNGFNGVSSVKAENIVYCVSSIQKIIDAGLDFSFTDGHATDGFSNFYFAKDIKNISDNIDFEAINAKYWKKEGDLDFKRRKEAEFLILDDIVNDLILGYIVSNKKAKDLLLSFGVNNKIAIKPDYYFY